MAAQLVLDVVRLAIGYARMFWYFLSVASFLPWAVLIINGAKAVRAIPRLADLPDGPVDEETGKLSVVVAARNEELHIEKALRSLAMQDHADYEIIVVDDRSTDGTAEIVDRLAGEYPERIKPVHVTELPDGWLGKCNALHQGGEAASGEFILFADADVEFQPSVLKRAHAYAAREEADQLAVIPENIVDSFWEKAMLNVFALCFMLGFPPHRAMQRNSGRFIGVGAFNMIRMSMYRKVQGHRFLRLQVLDDVGLGKLVKFSGGRVRVAWGHGQVRLRWYESLGHMIKGLEKNMFAATGYSAVKTVAMVVGVVIMFLWPWVGLWVGSTGARVVAGLALLLQIVTAGAAARRAGFSPMHGLTAIAGAALLVTALVRSMVATLRNRGISWRDSFYALKDLKQFKL